jgi:hypothetical protein
LTQCPPGPLLTVRAAVILLLTLVVGVLAGRLSYLTDHPAPHAVLGAGSAAAGPLMLFYAVMGG